MLRPLSVVVLPAVLSDHGLGRVWWTGGRVFRCAQLPGARCAAAVAAHAQGPRAALRLAPTAVPLRPQRAAAKGSFGTTSRFLFHPDPAEEEAKRAFFRALKAQKRLLLEAVRRERVSGRRTARPRICMLYCLRLVTSHIKFVIRSGS